MQKTRGYTLLEILIVLFIVSIVTTVALLSIGHNENKQMETLASEIAQRLSLAEEQALLEPKVVGLLLGEHSLQFTSLEHASKEKKEAWVPLVDHALGGLDIPKNIQLGIKTAEEKMISHSKEEVLNPQIIISTNGDMTPFTIYIGKTGEKPRYAIIGEANGQVMIKSLT